MDLEKETTDLVMVLHSSNHEISRVVRIFVGHYVFEKPRIQLLAKMNLFVITPSRLLVIHDGQPFLSQSVSSTVWTCVDGGWHFSHFFWHQTEYQQQTLKICKSNMNKQHN